MTKGVLFLLVGLFSLPALSRWVAAEVTAALAPAEAQGSGGYLAIGLALLVLAMLMRWGLKPKSTQT